MFAPPRNVEKLNICPRHRESLGLGWRRPSSKCSVPNVLSSHSAKPRERPKAERGITKWMSEHILRETGILVPVGSGVCCNCRIALTATGRVETPSETKSASRMGGITSENESSVPLLGPIAAGKDAESTLAPTKISEEETAFETPGGSLYSPSLEATLDITCTPASRARSRIAMREGSSPLEKMNQFLESKDVSPVRYPVSVPWSEASNRTRRRHVRKARQAVGAVLEEIAPRQSAHLWKTFVSFKSLEAQDSSSDTEDGDVDQVLMVALAECYMNASTWQARRQILSIVADKLQFRTVRSSAGAEAFDDLCDVVQRLGDSFMGMSWAKEQSERLRAAKRYLKSDFKVHVAKTSTVPDHCRQYALSDPCDKDYQSACDHTHQDTCHRCEELTAVLHEIDEGIQRIPAGQVKLDGVSTVANVEYGNTYIRVWKAYGIGPGKKIPLLKINIPANFQIARLSAVSSDKELCDQFSAVKSRKAPTSIPLKSAREDSPPASLSSESSELYACPEEGCTKSYQRFSALQRHLDCGKHVRALESETMLDKAVRGYAARLEGQFASVPQFGEDTISADAPARQSGLQMGWALRLTQTSRARFSDKQKEYLTNKFLIGETTGQKANPVHVARSMMTARDETGKRMFSSEEFLTAKQITSFFFAFSRQAECERPFACAVVSDEEEEEDGEAVNIETAFCELRDHVMANVQPTHPICFQSYNLCHMMSNSSSHHFPLPC
ncbi:unnamed protein product [Porites lobata]|uniref:C2H2-type domain-containing protein n=1 Tax=Porites lobata TaxID=104759 RepID=A0ABN8QQT6_9CNID|nr:unnamed protein product [Porites lobata]